MGRVRSWTDDALRGAVVASKSYSEVLRRLRLKTSGGSLATIRRYVVELDLETSHFTGQGWNVGARYRQVGPPAAPLDVVLVLNRPTTSARLRQRLIDAGLRPPHCERCGWAQRAPDGRLPLELDHINGDHDDNRLENLRILCPNCHSLQPTHRRRKRATSP